MRIEENWPKLLAINTTTCLNNPNSLADCYKPFTAKGTGYTDPGS